MYSVSFGLRKALIVIIFAVVGTASGVSAQSLATERDRTNNLTGAWTLNKDLSDDPAKGVREAMSGGSHAGPGGGHGSGTHGGSGAVGGGRGGMDPELMRLLEPPGRLTITQTSSSITFTDGNGRSQTLTTGNQKQKLPLTNRTVEVMTKWDDGRLVKETDLGDGMRLTETYSLVLEPRQLRVMAKLESSHLPRPVNVRRVYDAESRR
jgi:hypothetical protein